MYFTLGNSERYGVCAKNNTIDNEEQTPLVPRAHRSETIITARDASRVWHQEGRIIAGLRSISQVFPRQLSRARARAPDEKHGRIAPRASETRTHARSHTFRSDNNIRFFLFRSEKESPSSKSTMIEALSLAAGSVNPH